MLKKLTNIILMFTILMPAVAASDDEQLDQIYRDFFAEKIDLQRISANYDDGIIHVAKPGQPFLISKEVFMATNITPLAQMIEAGSLKFEGKIYILRRVVGKLLANDVGYLYSKVTMPDGQLQESVQKFSWVMQRTDGGWQVITDFDATHAPIDVLSGTFERVVE